MQSIGSFARTAGQSLSLHLDRLRRNLDSLNHRLRETIATALGQSVADAVRDAVHTVLSDPQTVAELQTGYGHGTTRRSSNWDYPGDLRDERWYDDLEDPTLDEDYLQDGDARPVQPTGPNGLPRALSVGCRAVVWWLRRQTGQYPVLTALSIGLVSGLVIYVGGPLAAAGVDLAESALNLLGLAGLLRSGIAALGQVRFS